MKAIECMLNLFVYQEGVHSGANNAGITYQQSITFLGLNRVTMRNRFALGLGLKFYGIKKKWSMACFVVFKI